jgi:phosphatidylserine decarboxylase
MQRPTLKSKLSLPGRLKHNNTNGTSSAPTSYPASRNTSPKRNMNSELKPALVLRVKVLKVS